MMRIIWKCLPKPNVFTTLCNNKSFNRFFKHIVYLTILTVLIPGYFIFELNNVLPKIVTAKTFRIPHVVLAWFIFINIVGNMIYGMINDSTITGRLLQPKEDSDWTICAVCETSRPPRSWHCNSCDICILKRDHHCSFFACCIGYFNFRYFYMFVFYVFIAMVYSFWFNICYISSVVSWSDGFVLLKFFFPLIHIAWDVSSEENLIIFITLLNVIIAIFTGILLFHHTKNIVNGRTSGENADKHKQNDKYNISLKCNMRDCFGFRWYLVWLSPFIVSHLPGSGIAWNEKNS